VTMSAMQSSWAQPRAPSNKRLMFGTRAKAVSRQSERYCRIDQGLYAGLKMVVWAICIRRSL